jgi:hypothetical protein
MTAWEMPTPYFEDVALSNSSTKTKDSEKKGNPDSSQMTPLVGKWIQTFSMSS